MKKKKLKIKYISFRATATDEQKKDYQRKIDQAFDIIFNDIDLDLTDKSINNKVNKLK